MPIPQTFCKGTIRDWIGLVAFSVAITVGLFRLDSWWTEAIRPTAVHKKEEPRDEKMELARFQQEEMLLLGRVMPQIENYVRESLAAPGTAKFAGWWNSSIQMVKPKHYIVESWVDAQNGFGAYIRHRFRAKVDDDKAIFKVEFF